MATLTEEEKKAAAKALGRHGMKPTSVDIAEQAAAGVGDVERKPSGAAAKDLTSGKGYGERRAPQGSAEERKEREAEEKRRKGPPAEMLRKHYGR